MTIKKEIAAFEILLPALELFLERHSILSRPAYLAQLALEEMVLNLIKYSHGPSNQIDIRVERRPHKLVIVLEDDGEPFDPRALPRKTFDQPLLERPSGGMGIHLVLTLMDEVRYDRIGTRNRLEMDIGLQTISKPERAPCI
jgi:anti-sigma regulatory factor (Ser/Thr protein kinase)